MNLNELFELQRKLDERIYKEHPPKEGEDRLAKKILALQVELGELANEWRGFKYWSKDQEPRTKTYKSKLTPGGEFYRGIYEANPLLEEHVDCLHFILSIGLDLNFETEPFFGKYTSPNLTRQFNFVFQDVSKLSESILEDFPEEDIAEHFYELVCGFIGLGDMLGFTWEQVEQAYLAKNKINHERQESGY